MYVEVLGNIYGTALNQIPTRVKKSIYGKKWYTDFSYFWVYRTIQNL